MIQKYSFLHKKSGKIKERLLELYERQVTPENRDDIPFEEWQKKVISSSNLQNYLAGYFDVPVKTWDKKYHEESQPWDLDNNFYGVPETIGNKK